MIPVSTDEIYELWDIQNEVGAEISVPACAELNGKTYFLAYMEDEEPDEEDIPDEDGVCVLALTETQNNKSLFALKDKNETVLGYVEEPEECVFSEVLGMLMEGLNR